MAYEAYENRPNNKAIVHAVGCWELRKRGGVSEDPERQTYHGPFSTLAEADAEALATGRRDVRRCSKCLDGAELREL